MILSIESMLEIKVRNAEVKNKSTEIVGLDHFNLDRRVCTSQLAALLEIS